MKVKQKVYCRQCESTVQLPHFCTVVAPSAVEPPPSICVNCRYYRPNEHAREHGECHLHPPQLARLEDTWVRPAVMWNHWCGQFRVNTELL